MRLRYSEGFDIVYLVEAVDTKDFRLASQAQKTQCHSVDLLRESSNPAPWKRKKKSKNRQVPKGKKKPRQVPKGKKKPRQVPKRKKKSRQVLKGKMVFLCSGTSNS